MADFFGITEWPGWHPPRDEEELPPVDADNRYEIWQENLPAFSKYGELATKWTRDANSTPCGIDTTQMQAHLNWTVDDEGERRELYGDLCVMEQAAALTYHQLAEDALKKAAKTPPSAKG